MSEELLGNQRFKREKAQENRLKVSGDGVFYSIQGEGSTIGKPAVFLRLHNCNLRCVWCDTKYTWDPNTAKFQSESRDWTIKETAQRIKNAWGCVNPNIPKRLVITGGEPLIQKDKIDKLINLLPGWIIEIETNGTFTPTPKMLKICQFNCSPKLSNSLNSPEVRIKPKVINVLKKANTQFKFVVVNNEDLEEIEQDYILGCNIDPRLIIVMPQGKTADEVRKNALRVVNYAKKKGYRLLTRLHVTLWETKQGV